MTRERVRQIAARAGVRSVRGASMYRCRRCQRVTRAESRVCGGCASPPAGPAVETLTCEGCGTVFERERRKVAANAKQARDRGRVVQVFCTAACAGAPTRALD